MLELDGMELIEAAFNCHITRGRPEGQSCIFVDDSLKGYDYALVNFEELFPHGHIYPFYKFKDDKALHEYMQLYHEIIDSTKTDEYSNFRHYNSLPTNTRGIKVPFSIKTRDSHLTATPIVYHPLNECICPLPTLLGADYGTHIIGAAGKIRSTDSQIDDVIQDWRYIEAKSGSMIAGDNWLDFISFITKTQAYTELSKTVPK